LTKLVLIAFAKKKKFFKVQIDKILLKINYGTKILSGFIILSIKKKILSKPRQKFIVILHFQKT
jgi:hypothetical protein